MTNANDLVYPFTALDMESFEPTKEYLGLTKREYFAAMAMQGMLANPNIFMPNVRPDEITVRLSV